MSDTLPPSDSFAAPSPPPPSILSAPSAPPVPRFAVALGGTMRDEARQGETIRDSGETIRDGARQGETIRDDPRPSPSSGAARRRSDPAGLVETTLDLAWESRNLKTAQGFQCARSAYEFIARVEGLRAAAVAPAASAPTPLQPTPHQPAPLQPTDIELSEAEWAALYGPPAPDESGR